MQVQPLSLGETPFPSSTVTQNSFPLAHLCNLISPTTIRNIIPAMQRTGCLLVVLCSVLSFANGPQAQDNAQHIPAAVISDPPPDPVHPATMASPDIPSHGAKMFAVIYIAAGEGPHRQC